MKSGLLYNKIYMHTQKKDPDLIPDLKIGVFMSTNTFDFIIVTDLTLIVEADLPVRALMCRTG